MTEKRFDDNTDGFDDSREPDDFQYVEDQARSAIGKLFDDEPTTEPSDSSSFVRGYERRVSDADETDHHAEIEEIYEETYDGAYAEPIYETHESDEVVEYEPIYEPPPERPRGRRATATSRLLSDEPISDYEAGRRDAAELLGEEYVPERSRRRTSNPDPRPAVKGTRTAYDEMPMESTKVRTAPLVTGDEDFDDFRTRYSPDELISGTKSARREERMEARRAQRDGYEERPVRAARTSPSDPAAVNPMRYILAGAVIVALAVLLFMILRISSLSRDLTDAHAQLADQTTLQQDYDQLRAHTLDLTNLLNNANTHIAELEEKIAQGYFPNDETTDPGENGETNETTTNNEPGRPTLPATHVVVRGDNLTRIANYFYGSTHPDLIARIVAANNLANQDDIREGQTLTIPALQ